MSRLKRGLVGDVTIGLMKDKDLKFVGWGDLHELDYIALKTGMVGKTPFHKHKKILDALDRDKRFEKSFFSRL